VVLNEVEQREGVCGISIWQFCDCRTYANSRALGRPRAFNNKGVFDEFRRPKLAAQTVKKAFRTQTGS
jgi:beta-glucuronidase